LTLAPELAIVLDPSPEHTVIDLNPATAIDLKNTTADLQPTFIDLKHNIVVDLKSTAAVIDLKHVVYLLVCPPLNLYRSIDAL
jgi:hypothetical protein